LILNYFRAGTERG